MQFIIIFLQGLNQLVDYLETKSAGLYVFKYFYQNSHSVEFIDCAKKVFKVLCFLCNVPIELSECL